MVSLIRNRSHVPHCIFENFSARLGEYAGWGLGRCARRKNGMRKLTSVLGNTIIVWYFSVLSTKSAAAKYVKCQESMEFSRLIELGAQFDNDGNVNEAISCFWFATKTRPYSSTAKINLSDLLIRSGKTSQALNVVSDALKAFRSRKSPGDEIDELSQLEYALARAFEAHGRDDEAEVK